MSTISTVEVQQVLNQSVKPGIQNQAIKEFVIDSRQVRPGCVFCAFVGQRVDGHQFITEALSKGACLVLLSDWQPDLSSQDSRLIVVADVQQALLDLATYWRQQLRVRVIAITGSNGKTTVKNMLKMILTQAGSCVATRGNQNNQLGVPLTLLRAATSTDYLVIEMGARQLGDVSHLVQVVKPDIALITNIGSAHIGQFGGLKNLLKAKAEIFQQQQHQSMALLDLDSPHYDYFRSLVASERNLKTIAHGHQSEAHKADLGYAFEAPLSGFYWQDQQARKQVLRVSLKLLGQHNTQNAAWAVLAALHLGIDSRAIGRGLQQVGSEPGRLSLRLVYVDRLSLQLRLLDDSYNASPESVVAALRVLQQQKGAKILVLADMLELGDQAIERHQQLVPWLIKIDLQALFLLGPLCRSMLTLLEQTRLADKVRWFADQVSLQAELWHYLKSYSFSEYSPILLFKGSNGMRLGQVIESFQV